MRRGAVLVVTLLVPATCVSVPTAPPAAARMVPSTWPGTPMQEQQ